MPKDSRLSQALLRWFSVRGRALPWRIAPAGARPRYPTWVAEVMLQQTQVATVVPYFERWMGRFPDVASVAAASQTEVLKAWEGLGYYRRARLLHQGMQQVMQHHAGTIPCQVADLRQLAGIGRYTAAAIASLCCNAPVIAVDANVARVASRLFCLSTATPSAVEQVLAAHLPAQAAGALNESLIELGALICKPKQPLCQACPLSKHCLAYQRQQVAHFPVATTKKPVPTRQRYALVWLHDGQVWLRQRPQHGMLGGLWGFPLSEQRPNGEELAHIKHAYSHFRLEVIPVRLTSFAALKQHSDGAGQDVALAELAHYPLSRLDHKILTAVIP